MPAAKSVAGPALKQSTFQFLKNLALNNNRDWFMQNKHLYEAARADAVRFVDSVCEAMSTIDENLPMLKAEKVLMRIYRDIRFSPDKTPYKTHFGAGLSPNGKMANEPGYFLSIGPGAEESEDNSFDSGCFLAAGFWMPAAQELKFIRQEIDYNFDTIDKILSAPSFKKLYPALSTEAKLKKIPKDYNADHPHADLLKHKSFVVVARFADSVFTSKDALQTVLGYFREAVPFVNFLREASKHPP